MNVPSHIFFLILWGTCSPTVSWMLVSCVEVKYIVLWEIRKFCTVVKFEEMYSPRPPTRYLTTLIVRIPFPWHLFADLQSHVVVPWLLFVWLLDCFSSAFCNLWLLMAFLWPISFFLASFVWSCNCRWSGLLAIEFVWCCSFSETLRESDFWYFKFEKQVPLAPPTDFA